MTGTPPSSISLYSKDEEEIELFASRIAQVPYLF
ncbi:hypothetical protein BRADI_1g69645v3 [Brachypodium distachyon]|uniref:Uncharacterized protein n=1 Tax=Brachypodium distachyon TaxID=15368 RepID=A0A2K2DUA2_BRADI|nr:hypothetical protein BRADI_1g69645v3 [Brachypodium distachyon]